VRGGKDGNPPRPRCDTCDMCDTATRKSAPCRTSRTCRTPPSAKTGNCPRSRHRPLSTRMVRPWQPRHLDWPTGHPRPMAKAHSMGAARPGRSDVEWNQQAMGTMQMTTSKSDITKTARRKYSEPKLRVYRRNITEDEYGQDHRLVTKRPASDRPRTLRPPENPEIHRHPAP